MMWLELAYGNYGLLSSMLARSRSFVYSSAIVGNAEDALWKIIWGAFVSVEVLCFFFLLKYTPPFNLENNWMRYIANLFKSPHNIIL